MSSDSGIQSCYMHPKAGLISDHLAKPLNHAQSGRSHSREQSTDQPDHERRTKPKQGRLPGDEEEWEGSVPNKSVRLARGRRNDMAGRLMFSALGDSPGPSFHSSAGNFQPSYSDALVPPGAHSATVVSSGLSSSSLATDTRMQNG